MKTLKWVALMVACGVILPLSGCASVIADFALNAIVNGLASNVLGGLTGTTAAA